MITLLAVLALKPLLLQLLYVVLAILVIACVIACINRYIAPIPPPILTIIAVIVLIVCILMFLPGCSYDEVASFGRAVDSGAASYYRTGYTPTVLP